MKSILRMKRVDALETLRAHLVKPQHSILIGPRQVGKTTLVKQLAKILEEQGEQFCFLTFEDPAILDAINQHPENIFNYTQLPSAMSDGNRLYIIIDEVQYAANPSNFLKLLYDKYKDQVKVIATGSSAFYIDKSFKDSLAGRKRVFELFPLSFEEFLHFKQEDGLAGELQEMRDREKYQSASRLKINLLFDEYLIYGGYPEVVLAETEQEKQEILKELVNSYMKKDALEAGVREEQKFFRLARLLADQAGNLVNNNELGNTLQLVGPTVDNYIYIMQKSFIVNLLTPFYGNLRKELTKMPKVYFSDNGLRNVLVNNFNKLSDREDKGQLLENYVHNRLRKLYDADNLHYWRTADGNEVDFIVEQGIKQGLAYEVKYNDAQFKPNKYQKFTDGYPGFELRCVSKEVSGGDTVEVVRL
ncbi:ATP-binding protein [Mucilaginibacter flavidus]|uniref:ATP-binding protein n=1 Tax=Mucilaginibacter flavidus TaxID=2949309 RepID=UPI0020922665|nr:ATP-binding protein [Mucilaginibacter flavidus]MCO5945251.1 ATP-binding protein [Mucilaginibacter flavidus]